MNKYHNSKIYKIVSKNTKKYYVGGTIQELRIRFNNHKHKYKHNIKNEKSREIFDFGECSIVLIEEFSCENKNQLETREQYWINYLLETGEELVNKKIGIMNYNHKTRDKKHKQVYNKKYNRDRRNKNSNKEITFDRKSYMNDYNKKYNHTDYNRKRYLDSKFWSKFNEDISEWVNMIELY